jgi:hypothetical protein
MISYCPTAVKRDGLRSLHQWQMQLGVMIVVFVDFITTHQIPVLTTRMQLICTRNQPSANLAKQQASLTA